MCAKQEEQQTNAQTPGHGPDKGQLHALVGPVKQLRAPVLTDKRPDAGRQGKQRNHCQRLDPRGNTKTGHCLFTIGGEKADDNGRRHRPNQLGGRGRHTHHQNPPPGIQHHAELGAAEVQQVFTIDQHIKGYRTQHQP